MMSVSQLSQAKPPAAISARVPCWIRGLSWNLRILSLREKGYLNLDVNVRWYTKGCRKLAKFFPCSCTQAIRRWVECNSQAWKCCWKGRGSQIGSEVVHENPSIKAKGRTGGELSIWSLSKMERSNMATKWTFRRWMKWREELNEHSQHKTDGRLQGKKPKTEANKKHQGT